MAPANHFVHFIIPTEYLYVKMYIDDSPITCAWEGGSALASDKKLYGTRGVTRKEYLEYGSNICSTRFDTPRGLQEGGKEPADDEDVY
jgi:actin-related protein